MALPSDVIRAGILPFLDLATRMDANSVLDRDSRLVKKVDRKDFAITLAVSSMMRLLYKSSDAKTERDKVKTACVLFQFLQTPFGRIQLMNKRVAKVILQKIEQWNTERVAVWWKRSIYRKKLKAEMEQVGHIIVANGFAV